MNLLSLEHLTIGFGSIRPVDRVDFSVAAGEMMGLVGESGSGKSLILRAILGLLPRHASISGRIIWQGPVADALDFRYVTVGRAGRV